MALGNEAEPRKAAKKVKMAQVRGVKLRSGWMPLRLNFPREWEGYKEQDEGTDSDFEDNGDEDEEEDEGSAGSSDKLNGNGRRNRNGRSSEEEADAKVLDGCYGEVARLAYKPKRFTVAVRVSEDEFYRSAEFMAACRVVVCGRWCMDGAGSLAEAAATGATAAALDL